MQGCGGVPVILIKRKFFPHTFSLDKFVFMGQCACKNQDLKFKRQDNIYKVCNLAFPWQSDTLKHEKNT